MENQSALDTLMERLVAGDIPDDTALGDAIDSLTFIDLFLDIEREYSSTIALDDIVACRTVGDLRALMAAARASLDASRGAGR